MLGRELSRTSRLRLAPASRRSPWQREGDVRASRPPFTRLSNPVGGVFGSAVGTASIVDDDAPGLSVTDVAVREGDVARVELRLWPAAPAPVDVTYTTLAGSAQPTRDYVATSGVAHFDVGQTATTVDVPTLGDNLAEGVETFTLALSEASGAPIGSGVGNVSLTDAALGVDFNFDGHTDVLWQHDSGTALAWFMNVAQQTGSAALLPSEPPDAAWRIVGTGAFHSAAAGQADVLWRNVVTGELRAALMDGITRIGEPQTLVPNQTVDWNWLPVATGDFNLDGKSDVLWRHQVTGTLLVWLLDGVVRTAELPTVPAGPVGSSWQVAGTGDFNRDGTTDVLFRHATSGNFVVWLMDVASATGVVRMSGGFLNPEAMPQLGWQVVSARDFDRDGGADVLVAEQRVAQARAVAHGGAVASQRRVHAARGRPGLRPARFGRLLAGRGAAVSSHKGVHPRC